jgi:hypothetical protein
VGHIGMHMHMALDVLEVRWQVVIVGWGLSLETVPIIKVYRDTGWSAVMQQ